MAKVGLHVFPFWTAHFFVWTAHFGWTARLLLYYGPEHNHYLFYCLWSQQSRDGQKFKTTNTGRISGRARQKCEPIQTRSCSRR